MKEYIIATSNKHKVLEIEKELNNQVKLISLSSLGFTENIPEEEETLEGNAIEKAKHIYNLYKKDCFADDTGLEVEALGGRPGVYSARYAGEGCSYEDNVKKLLNEMNSEDNRQACFKTVICLIEKGEIKLFTGVCEGKILRQPQGKGGFGYDPIFIPDGKVQSFAEMSLEDKNMISHRGLAIKKLAEYILK